jgi:plasmid rolling circle replication initiator protein Rep
VTAVAPSCLDTTATTGGKLPPSGRKRARNPLLNLYLTEDPEHGRKSYHKAHAQRLEGALNRAGLGRMAARVGWCSDLWALEPGELNHDTGELRRGRVLGHSSCHVRLCPICQSSRASKMGARVRAGLPAAVAELRPAWAHLTLTVKNVPLEELRLCILEISAALHRLFKRREFQATGWIRNTEVTYNRETGEAHPHVHVLLALPPEYFDGRPGRWVRSRGGPRGGRRRWEVGYLEKDQYIALWQAVARLDYAPSIAIQRVRLDQEDGQRALLEVCKYGMKPAELAELPADRLPVLLEQLAGLRQIGIGGALRRFLRPVEPPPATLIEARAAELLRAGLAARAAVLEPLHQLEGVPLELGGFASSLRLRLLAAAGQLSRNVHRLELPPAVGELLRWCRKRRRYERLEVPDYSRSWLELASGPLLQGDRPPRDALEAELRRRPGPETEDELGEYLWWHSGCGDAWELDVAEREAEESAELDGLRSELSDERYTAPRSLAPRSSHGPAAIPGARPGGA